MNWLLSGAVFLPFVAALLHPALAWLFQKGEKNGLPMSVTVGVSNLATVSLFVCYLRPNWSAPWCWLDGLALTNGVFFFLGQWFSVQAVKSGDLVVHSSALGIKLLLVAGLSLAIGLEEGNSQLLIAVALAAVAIFLLAGGNLRGWQKHRATLGWTIVGTVFFGIGDVLTSWQASELGMARWLILMMTGSGCCAIITLSPKRKKLTHALRQSQLRWLLLGLGLLMGTQAVLINSAFAIFKEPTVSNIVFSIRGLLAIPFLMLIQQKMKGVVSLKSLAGACLMLFALILAVL